MNEKIYASFNKQGLMTSINARLIAVEAGLVKIRCPYSEAVTQQHGCFHAGIITSIVDVACGYAALTTMTAEADVLSVEYKVNFLRPTKAEAIIATGNVIKSGRRLVICEGEVVDTNNKQIAKMIATMIPIQ